jgi:hypothetical protein
MKIARAMKQVSRLKGEISTIKNRLSACLNTLNENEFTENFNELRDQFFSKVNELVNLKTLIMIENITKNKFQTILALGELKSYIEFLKELEPKNGVCESDRFGSPASKFKSQLTLVDKNEMLEECQKLINEYTDELDEFNATINLEEKEVVISIPTI